jgi:Na+/H+-dicarboxylate symporter
MQIWKKILIGMGLGILLGYFCGENSPIALFNGENGANLISLLNIVGEAFLKMLKMVVIPLVFFSLALGIASMENIKAIGNTGFKVVFFFLFTTALSICIGLAIAYMVDPGSYISIEKKTELMNQYSHTLSKYTAQPASNDGVLVLFRKSVLSMIPDNPFESLAKMQILQIIFFALFFGIGLTFLEPKKRELLVGVCSGVNDVMTSLVGMIMNLAPYGVCTLMAAAISKMGIAIMQALAAYVFTVMAAFIIFVIVVDFPAIVFFGKISPLAYIKHMKESLIVSFSTSSSSAALPVTMKCCEENMGIPKKISSFVLPLGATINMNGTSIFQGVSVVFIAQVFGVDLSFGDLTTIVLMATLASVGTAGVPGAGICMLVMVFNAINPALIAGIGLIMGVERFIDMSRTVINVCGDSTACLFIKYFEKPEQNPTEVEAG